MQKGIFSVYDVKAKIYLGLFESFNNETAIRDFVNSVRNERQLNSHPDDFQLHRLGAFTYADIQENDDSEIVRAGIVTERPLMLLTARDVVGNEE